MNILIPLSFLVFFALSTIVVCWVLQSKRGLTSREVLSLPRYSANAPSIPFYTYGNHEFTDLLDDCKGVLKSGADADELFLKSVEDHPWRVKDPNQALIFILPIPWGKLAYDRFCPNKSKLLPAITNVLKRSPIFKRYGGNDHLVVNSHYNLGTWLKSGKRGPLRHRHKTVDSLRSMVKKMNTTSHYQNLRSSCGVVIPFSTTFRGDAEFEVVKKDLDKLSALLEIRPQDNSLLHSLYGGLFSSPFAAINNQAAILGRRYLEGRKYTFGFAGQASKKIAYYTRRIGLQHLKGFMSPNILVNTAANAEVVDPSDLCAEGELEGCTVQWHLNSDIFSRAIRESKFCLFFSGDDWSSQRLYDCIAIGTIPVVVSDGLLDRALPFQCNVNWGQLIIQIPQAEFLDDPRTAMMNWLPDISTVTGQQEIGFRLLELYNTQPKVIYQHPASRTTEFILEHATRKCLPEALIRTLRDLPCSFQDFSKVTYNIHEQGRRFQREAYR